MSDEAAVEVGHARVSAEGCTPERAERVSRLIFSHLHSMLAEGCLRGGAPRVVAHLQVPSFEVDWAEPSDDAIARQGAAWIYRWLRIGA